MFFTFFILLFFEACDKNPNCTIISTNGVLVYSNKNTPSNKNKNLKLDLIAELKAGINSFESIQLLSTGKSGIYIIDNKNIIYKFDYAGKFIKSIGHSGLGPGEFTYLQSCFEANDTLYAVLPDQGKVSKFTPDGNFINSKTIQFVFKPFVCNGKLIDNLTRSYPEGSHSELVSYNSNMQLIKNSGIKQFVRYDFKNNSSYNFEDDMFNYSCTDSIIYYAHNSDTDYQIDVYNDNFNLIKKIKKNYKTILLSEDEILKNKKIMEESGINNYQAKLKKSIYAVATDKNGTLWIKTPNESNKSSYKYDLFQNGIYSFCFYEPKLQKSEVYFYADKMITVDESLSTVSIFEYSY